MVVIHWLYLLTGMLCPGAIVRLSDLITTRCIFAMHFMRGRIALIFLPRPYGNYKLLWQHAFCLGSHQREVSLGGHS